LGYFIEEACVAMQCGNETDYRQSIQAFWSELRRAKLTRRNAHSAAIDLLLAVARYSRYEPPGSLIDCLKRIEDTDTLGDLEAVVTGFVSRCCAAISGFYGKKSRLVER
jgi:hypothetical protein